MWELVPHQPYQVSLFNDFITIKWVSVEQGQSYLMARSCLFRLDWSHFFMPLLSQLLNYITIFVPHSFFIG